MRLRDFLTEHAIPWPPITFAPLSAGSRVLMANDLRLATLLEVRWNEDNGDTAIDLWLNLNGRQLPTSVPVTADRLDAYQHFYQALEQGLGQSLAAIEDLEV